MANLQRMQQLKSEKQGYPYFSLWVLKVHIIQSRANDLICQTFFIRAQIFLPPCRKVSYFVDVVEEKTEKRE